MNCKETEKLTGISRRNLRFYEDQGLIEPSRNPVNDYRDYSEKDIERLKVIRGLRTIDVPLDVISEYLNKKITLSQLSELQEQYLLNKQKEVQTALNICKELHSIKELEGNTVDSLLNKIDTPEAQKNLFTEWKDDYKMINELEHKVFFIINPDKTVHTAKDLTIELCRYADENHINLEITKEGLPAEFVMDGIPYTASTETNNQICYINNVFDTQIFCEAKNISDIYKNPLTTKQKFLRFLHNNWFAPLLFIVGSCLWIGREGIEVIKSLDFWIINLGILGFIWFLSYINRRKQ